MIEQELSAHFESLNFVFGSYQDKEKWIEQVKQVPM